MANDKTYLSRLMRISWDIQTRRPSKMTRSKALKAAWAFFQNEEIAVSYLTRRLNHNKEVSRQVKGQYQLFQ